MKSMLPVIVLALLMKATSCKKSDLVSYAGSSMLSERRSSLAAASAGNKVLFAGGEIPPGSLNTNLQCVRGGRHIYAARPVIVLQDVNFIPS